MLAETDGSGNILSEYIYFNGQRLARFEPSNGGSAVYYYLSDRLGSAKQIVSINLNGTLNGCNSTTPTGCIVAESDYYPYGGERVITADSTSNTYKYTGHERDTETNLDHTDNRQYSSNTGRWLAPDPSKRRSPNPQHWNRYAYVGGNPSSRFDPDGADAECIGWADDEEGWGYCFLWETIPDLSSGSGATASGLVGTGLQLPFPSNPWYRTTNYATIMADWGINSAIAQQNSSSGQVPSFPFQLVAVGSCYLPQGQYTGNFELDVTYQIQNQFGQDMGAGQLQGVSIGESFPYTYSSSPAILQPLGGTSIGAWTSPSSWSVANGTISSNGTFTDNYSQSGTGNTAALQEYTATMPSGSPFINQPLDIIMNGTSYGGVNQVNTTANSVSVNNLTSYTLCPTPNIGD